MIYFAHGGVQHATKQAAAQHSAGETLLLVLGLSIAAILLMAFVASQLDKLGIKQKSDSKEHK